MTKAEAIAMLKRIQEPEAWEPQINQAAFEALDMAIEALSQESSEDVISRQAAIDALKGLPTWWADEGGYYGGAQPPMVALLDPEDAVSAIEKLPSAQPARKKGKWIPQDHNKTNGIASTLVYYYPKCSVCGHCGNYTNFCPNCGAKMDEEGKDD